MDLLIDMIWVTLSHERMFSSSMRLYTRSQQLDELLIFLLHLKKLYRELLKGGHCTHSCSFFAFFAISQQNKNAKKLPIPWK